MSADWSRFGSSASSGLIVGGVGLIAVICLLIVVLLCMGSLSLLRLVSCC